MFADGETSGNFHNLCFLICDRRLRLDLPLRVALEIKLLTSVKCLEQCLTTSKGYDCMDKAPSDGDGAAWPPRAPSRAKEDQSTCQSRLGSLRHQ